MSYKSKKSGFTLTELMIVTAIIGILYTVMPTITNLYHERARQTQAKVSIRTIQQVIEDGRIDTNRNLGQITGSYCSDCMCRSTSPGFLTGTLQGVSSTNSCALAWSTAIDNIFSVAGRTPGSSKAYYRDVWNAPYLLDENEGEHSFCDRLRSSFGVTGESSGGMYSVNIPRLDNQPCP